MSTTSAIFSPHSIGFEPSLGCDPTVEAAQTLLNRLGVRLKIDGILGRQTRAALQGFQSRFGLPATGTLDRATTIALQNAAESLSVDPFETAVIPADHAALRHRAAEAHARNAYRLAADSVPGHLDCVPPRDLQFAQLAQAAYHVRLAPQGWSPVLRSAFAPNSAGLRAAEADGFAWELYLNQEANALVLAFRGSDDSADYITDAEQALGKRTTQYDAAIELATETKQFIATAYPGATFHIVGHSLGGGLASAAGIATQTETITFNAAGLHPHTIALAKARSIGLRSPAELIRAYYLEDELLTITQSQTVAPEAVGTRFEVPSVVSRSQSSFARHGIVQVVEELKHAPECER